MKQYKIKAIVELRIKSNNYKTAIEHIRNGFIDEWELIKVIKDDK